MKYGIFLSSHEMKKRPEKLANVVETDEWIGAPEEMFETREAALAKLKEDKEKYSPCIREMRGNGGVYYDCKVYFVAGHYLRTFCKLGIELYKLLVYLFKILLWVSSLAAGDVNYVHEHTAAFYML